MNSLEELKDTSVEGIDTVELRLLKLKQVELARKKLEAVRSNPLAFYKPHHKQDLFHRAGHYKRRMVRAGNRFGKSLMGCAEDVAWLLGCRPWYAKTDEAYRVGIPQHPVKLLVITTDWEKVNEVFTSKRGEGGKLWKMLPPDFVKGHKTNHSGVIDEIEGYNGSLIRFDTVKSWTQNPQSSESVDWDAIHVDEPCPEGMWISSSRGLIDRDGSAWFTLTPLSEPWIQKMFFGDARTTERYVDQNGRPFFWAISGSTEDNAYLSQQAIDDYAASLTVEERQCRLHGIPLYLTGLVYKEFNWAIHGLHSLPHGWKHWHDVPMGWTMYVSIDPHPQTPHAVLFMAVNEHNQMFIVDELFVHTTIEDLSKQILERLQGRQVGWILCDPFAYINDPITGSTMADEFARCGVYVRKATKDLTRGIQLVKQTLLMKDQLYVSPECRRFLFEINNWSWAKDNKPMDKDDHLMECFYRLVVSKPFFMSPEYVAMTGVSEEEFNDGLDFSY